MYLWNFSFSFHSECKYSRTLSSPQKKIWFTSFSIVCELAHYTSSCAILHITMMILTLHTCSLMFAILIALSAYLAALIGCIILLSQLCECIIILIELVISVALALAYYDILRPISIPSYNPQFAVYLRMRRTYHSLNRIPAAKIEKLIGNETSTKNRRNSNTTSWKWLH